MPELPTRSIRVDETVLPHVGKRHKHLLTHVATVYTQLVHCPAARWRGVFVHLLFNDEGAEHAVDLTQVDIDVLLEGDFVFLLDKHGQSGTSSTLAPKH